MFVVLKDATLPNGPEGSIIVDIICPILYIIIQAIEEGEKLCSLFKGHQELK